MSVPRRVCVLYHGHCFDGVASAAVLGGFLRRRYPAARIEYRGVDHQPGGSFVPVAWLRGEVNAVVDFRYTTDPRLTWYFDHHPSGVISEAERRHLLADRSGRKVLDPSRPSCAGLVRDVLRDRFGHEAPPAHEDLVAWADVIDAARYRDAREACSFDGVARRWALLVDALGDTSFLAPHIDRLARGVSLQGLFEEEPALHERSEGLVEERAAGLEALGRSLRIDGGVVRYELPVTARGRFPRFGPYLLAPEAHYAVGVIPRPGRVSVSAGLNPWNRPPRPLDVGGICRAYGGGGHAVVGGVTLGAEEIEAARRIAEAIGDALRRGTREEARTAGSFEAS